MDPPSSRLQGKSPSEELPWQERGTSHQQGPRGPSLPYLALVRATLSRLGSFKNPMPWCSLARTQERMMKSFSRPWNASTLAISTSYKKRMVITSWLPSRTLTDLSHLTNEPGTQSLQSPWSQPPAQCASRQQGGNPCGWGCSHWAFPVPSPTHPAFLCFVFLTLAICFPVIKAYTPITKNLTLYPS